MRRCLLGTVCLWLALHPKIPQDHRATNLDAQDQPRSHPTEVNGGGGWWWDYSEKSAKASGSEEPSFLTSDLPSLDTTSASIIANGAADALSRFPQRSSYEEEDLRAENTQILHWLQSSLTNASISATSSSSLIPLHQVLICETHVLLRYFGSGIRSAAGKRRPSPEDQGGDAWREWLGGPQGSFVLPSGPLWHWEDSRFYCADSIVRNPLL